MRTVYRDYYKGPARRRGIAFELTLEEFAALVALPCYYCGTPPVNVCRAPHETLIYSGIDRRDNKAGYTRENSLPCCRPCNVSKNDGTVGDYIERCKQVAKLHA
jgi:hypothetical protein